VTATDANATPGASGASGLKNRWRFFAVIWLLLSLVAALWSLGMPLNTGPDEPSHFVKAAAVVRGELGGVPSADGTVVQVPAYVAYTPGQTCTAYNPEQTADCVPLTPEPTGVIMSGTTTAGAYNPVYYALVGWPTLFFTDQAGLYAMRIVSGMIASALFAVGFMMLRGWSRPVIPLLGALIAVTPMVVYVNGIVNPSSLEIAGAFAAFVALLSIVLDPRQRLLTERMLVLAIAGGLACSTRAISPLWVAILLLVPLVLLSRQALVELLRRRAVWLGIAAVTIVAISAFGWTLAVDSLALNAPQTSGSTTYDNVGASPAFGFVKMILLSVNLGQEMIGILGWFDTVLPPVVYFVWSALLGALAVTAGAILRGRRALLAIILLAGMIVGPAIVQAAYITGGGFIWQGRYTLPLFVCAVTGIAAVVSETWSGLESQLARRLIVIVTTAWIACQVLSFVEALRRFSVGASGSYLAIFTAPAWAPPLGSAVLTVILLACLTLFAWLLFRRTSGAAATR
jgi:hypothetical protein